MWQYKLMIKVQHTWVWRKLTNTGLFLNFKAVCPQNWKSDLILCVLRRGKMICSNDTPFLKEVNQLKSLFLVNNYISKFLIRFLKNLWPKIIFYQIIFHLMKKILILRCVLSKFHMLAYIQSGLLTVYPTYKTPVWD